MNAASSTASTAVRALLPSDSKGLADHLNRYCQCYRADLHAAVGAEAARLLSPATLAQLRSQSALYAATVAFVDAEQVAAIRALIRLSDRLAATSEWASLLGLPLADPGRGPGLLMGYDFHITADGARLIEINTNAGGAVPSALALLALKDCCERARLWREAFLRLPYPAEDRLALLLDLPLAEWRRLRGDAHPRRVAIVDANPPGQALHAEFLAYAEHFGAAGIACDILDPAALRWSGTELLGPEGPIDLVYNRLTDFDFSEPAQQALAEAWAAGKVLITPHPQAYQRLADKRRLITLSDPEALARLPLTAAERQLLLTMVPCTRLVSSFDPEALWASRAQWFFKPATGYGSRAAYRGDKLTRRVYAEILAQSAPTRDARADGAGSAGSPYIAQQLVQPALRKLRLPEAETDLKWDLRAYTWAGELLLLSARLYQGQTTNFRTPGGGFAPVLVIDSAALAPPC